ncbi:MAG: lysophospholipid acyltransferase family protein, partial [Phycisphaerales bacterium]|nr:lysophospholipid acyltransferase family protein [Phycisphaerales bacterium]
LCFIADQDAGRKGVFVDFFNRPASWYRSIALLAMRYQTPIIVGHCPRVSANRFRYRAVVERIIMPEEWADERDPVRWITAQYAQAFERAIATYPEQYLWMHRRWKSQPRGARTE